MPPPGQSSPRDTHLARPPLPPLRPRPNKGFGGPAPVPLPPHKLSPHDVVALRPNSQPQGAGGPPLCSGLVYRVKETAIVVAVDDMPEDGLEQPLRLEKLANEVRRGGGGGGGGGAAGAGRQRVERGRRARRQMLAGWGG
jgi:hypothetical protein